MSRVEAAAGMDRLPWLPDEPKPQTAELKKQNGHSSQRNARNEHAPKTPDRHQDLPRGSAKVART